MKIQFTKGVAVSFAVAAGCAILGFALAPGWWAFSAFSAWVGVVFALGGKSDPNTPLFSRPFDRDVILADTMMDPAYRNIDPLNIHRDHRV